MVSALFSEIGTALTSFFTTLNSGLNGVTSLVWDTTNSKPTFFGGLLIISATLGIGYMIFRMIKNLVSLRG